MEFFFLIVLGFFVGGFINLLSDVLPYRQSISRPRYPDGTTRPVSGWISVLAFILKKRSSPNDPSSKLSWRYPIVEIATAGLFVITYMLSKDISDISTPQLLFYLVHVSLLILITVIDIEHKLILFVVVLPSIALALLDALILPSPTPNIRDSLVGAGLGFGVFFVMYQGGVLFNYVMGQIRQQDLPTAFGYGDVMLITFTGALLGFAHTIIAIFIAVFLGAFGAIAYLVIRYFLRGGYNAFTALPYGPYIVIATLVMLLYGDPIRVMMIGY